MFDLLVYCSSYWNLWFDCCVWLCVCWLECLMTLGVWVGGGFRLGLMVVCSLVGLFGVVTFLFGLYCVFACGVLFDLVVSCVVRYSGCCLFSLRFVYVAGC